MGTIERVIQKFAVQTAVYWGNPQPDGYGGMTYDAPREIKIRWDDSQNLATKNGSIPRDQENTLSDAKLLTNEDLEVGGLIWLGTLDDLFIMYNNIYELIWSDPVCVIIQGETEEEYNGNYRQKVLTVNKSLDSVIIDGYPKDYDITYTFAGIPALTDYQFQTLTDEEYESRLNSFMTYIEGLNLGLVTTNYEYNTGESPYGTDAITCPIGGVPN